MRSSRRPSLSVLALAAALTLGAACNTAPKLPPGADNPGLASQGLERVNPRDIAVLKIENQTGRSDLPLAAMRASFHAGLVERFYSPLALEFVDGKTTEASYRPGSSSEDALLKVVVTGWDDTYWRTHARLVIDADVWLLDAGSASDGAAPAGQTLWGGHVSRTMEMGRQREVMAGDGPLLARTVQDFVQAVLASLPARKP